MSMCILSVAHLHPCGFICLCILSYNSFHVKYKFLYFLSQSKYFIKVNAVGVFLYNSKNVFVGLYALKIQLNLVKSLFIPNNSESAQKRGGARVVEEPIVVNQLGRTPLKLLMEL
ncbi:hypothetical protein B0O95_10210 [Mycetohabitans endofungorum]|uniref:Uncharacterized protein n=1 Tax=Mycetohabitans endofungorum TaxID=417203 RepID=A0A2P5KD24_9BURK|nr:hypothetical protein B0O95_10210 [Mycetohabitans endofungorum]